MKLVALNKRDQNKAAFDPWSAIHMTTGLFFGLIGVGFGWSMAAAIAYDLAENVFERTGTGQKFFKTSGPENPWNIVTDIAVFAVGWAAGNKYITK